MTGLHCQAVIDKASFRKTYLHDLSEVGPKFIRRFQRFLQRFNPSQRLVLNLIPQFVEFLQFVVDIFDRVLIALTCRNGAKVASGGRRREENQLLHIFGDSYPRVPK